jgi:hypothetical protein
MPLRAVRRLWTWASAERDVATRFEVALGGVVTALLLLIAWEMGAEIKADAASARRRTALEHAAPPAAVSPHAAPPTAGLP